MQRMRFWTRSGALTPVGWRRDPVGHADRGELLEGRAPAPMRVNRKSVTMSLTGPPGGICLIVQGRLPSGRNRGLPTDQSASLVRADQGVGASSRVGMRTPHISRHPDCAEVVAAQTWVATSSGWSKPGRVPHLSREASAAFHHVPGGRVAADRFWRVAGLGLAPLPVVVPARRRVLPRGQEGAWVSECCGG